MKNQKRPHRKMGRSKSKKIQPIGKRNVEDVTKGEVVITYAT